MKKSVKKIAALSMAIAISIAMPVSAFAEVLVYPGNTVLKPDGDGRASVYSSIDTSNNDVTINSGGAYAEAVYGGLDISGSGLDITNNTVVINSANIGNVYGGNDTAGRIINNKVEVINATVDGFVLGGLGTGEISGNTIIMNNSKAAAVIGASSDQSLMTDNTVTITGGEVTTTLIGTRAYGATAAAINNVLTLNNVKVSAANIYGVDVVEGTAVDNILNISGNTTGARVVGANSMLSGTLRNNTVNIFDGSFTSVYGAIGNNTDNNKVNISSGNIENVYGGYGTSGTSIDNVVDISGGNISGTVYGGRILLGIVNGNKVTISGTATVTGSLYGGHTNGVKVTDTASDNIVTISGGSVNGDIYGGRSNMADAANNVVNITGGSINNNIIAGSSVSGNSYNNVVNLGSAAILGSLTNIYGGTSVNGVVSGNTLNSSWKGSIASIGNFEYINITLPASTLPGDTIFNTTNKANLAGSNIKVAGIEDSNTVWQTGDYVTLFSNFDGTATLYDSTVHHGLTNTYDFKLTDEAGNITAYIERTQKTIPQERSLLEGRLASTSFLNTGIDFMLDAGMDNMREELKSNGNLFAAFGYSKDKFHTASQAEISGTNLIIGSMKTINSTKIRTMFGGFVEAGWGQYNTRDSFDGNNINANGNTNYYGVGLIAHQDIDNGLYLEGSLRAGRANTKYKSTQLNQVLGVDTRYDVKSTYYGGHIGLGIIKQLSDKNDLDIYGKYLYLHNNGATADIAGDTLTLSGIDSHRLRAGLRIHHKANAQLTSSVGLAYEYELGGTSNGSANNLDIMSAKIKGGTMLGELAMVHKPKNQEKFSMKVGLQGYVGRRQGFSSNMHLKWEF